MLSPYDLPMTESQLFYLLRNAEDERLALRREIQEIERMADGALYPQRRQATSVIVQTQGISAHDLFLQRISARDELRCELIKECQHKAFVMHKVSTALSKLTDKQRRVLFAFAIQGMDIPCYARRENITTNAAYKRKSSVVSKLLRLVNSGK